MNHVTNTVKTSGRYGRDQLRCCDPVGYIFKSGKARGQLSVDEGRRNEIGWDEIEVRSGCFLVRARVKARDRHRASSRNIGCRFGRVDDAIIALISAKTPPH